MESMYLLVNKRKLGYVNRDGKPVAVVGLDMMLLWQNMGQPFKNENRRQRMMRRVAKMLGIDLADELTVRFLKGVKVFGQFLAKANPQLGMRAWKEDEVMDFCVVDGRVDDAESKVVYVGEFGGGSYKLIVNS